MGTQHQRSHEEIAQAQRLATHALSRASLTLDFRQKTLWQQIAEEWLARVETLQARQHGNGAGGQQAGILLTGRTHRNQS
jgi:hypothetical protein